MTIPIPQNEEKRLRALRGLNILDTESELDYDSITKLASFICGTKISLISLVDENRQWFKSKVGTDLCEGEREISFCGHAILEPQDIFMIPDSRRDERFKNNPYVTADEPIIFYAGVPLIDRDGNALGTLCVIDDKPGDLNEQQQDALRNLGHQVENLFELRKRNIDLEVTKNSLAKHNELLRDFAGVVSHDMKMPLANLILTSDILRKEYGTKLDEKAKNYLQYLKNSSLSLSEYISNILDHYESSAFDKDETEKFEINILLEEIIDLLDIKYDCEVHFPEKNKEIIANRAALKQIFLNLIGNSLKYNDKEKIVISIDCQERETNYRFTVEDNGMGIDSDKIDTVFQLFKTGGKIDREGNKGHGIGLSTVKKLVEALGGDIDVESEIGEGTTFIFTVEKE